jgi:hypothetical protein
MRGSKRLGIVELVDEMDEMHDDLAALTPLIFEVIEADGTVTDREARLLSLHLANVNDAQELAVSSESLAARTLQACSMLRGLAEPPGRLSDLIEDYARVHGEKPVAVEAA